MTLPGNVSTVLKNLKNIITYHILSNYSKLNTDSSKNSSIFFIVDSGRSGTKFLANLLDNDPNSTAMHEPTDLDKIAYLYSFKEGETRKYVSGYRKRNIYKTIKKYNPKIYGEVNSYLRRHVKYLKEVFPGAKYFHLVRDGRDVIRSFMSRNTLTDNDLSTYYFRNKSYNNKLPENWDSIDRFQKLCWYWRIEVEFVNEEIKDVINFENILKDYDYFNKKVLLPTGIDIQKKLWNKTISNPVNVTKKYIFPPWNEWKNDYKDKFIEICGTLMDKFNYKLD